jgi:hypothetical protein
MSILPFLSISLPYLRVEDKCFTYNSKQGSMGKSTILTTKKRCLILILYCTVYSRGLHCFELNGNNTENDR